MPKRNLGCVYTGTLERFCVEPFCIGISLCNMKIGCVRCFARPDFFRRAIQLSTFYRDYPSFLFPLLRNVAFKKTFYIEMK